MKTIAICMLAATMSLVGCGSVNEMTNSLNGSLSEMMGTYTAPTLASQPTPTPGCDDTRCKRLDDIEKRGYELARQKRITWTKLVSVFYENRAKLYPDSNDGASTRELISYQRMLAEQIDLGKITEAQWAYLIDSKTTELARRSAGRKVTCNTENVGTSEFPSYQTICR